MRSEYLNPAMSVADSGDFAVLAYNLNTYVLDGEWRIVHSHWAFTQTAKAAIAS
ncbi:hypothetical protein [Streptomyces sp. ME18-1-4]|uniref:hypothetical protein n=1 Tax=Streptomyces sp. ME18-1-4 TaxID=3028685 RepID=UPI0029B6BCE8|nr:hypothetical protein [Streptomyces sp. ME18-1-4]MDX3248108.1 hypothetical protein [Streptomyces sp. ME18-1-4]